MYDGGAAWLRLAGQRSDGHSSVCIGTCDGGHKPADGDLTAARATAGACAVVTLRVHV